MRETKKMKQPKKKYKCFCCGYYTFEENVIINHDICPVCAWENDGIQNFNHTFCGGANEVSLNEARENFKLFDVSNKDYLDLIRKPREDEKEGLDDWTVFS